MKEIYYPTADKIIELNLLSLNIIKAKKGDKAELLAYQKLKTVVAECKNLKGDIYDKAAVLLKGIVQKHPFASGNRRTAFAVTKYFLLKNKGYFKIKDKPEQARVMIGIRENYYNYSEIKEWIKNGKIKEFKR